MSLAQKLETMRRPTVLVLGDSYVDVDVQGNVSRQAAEAPSCPVFLESCRHIRSGGAGAVAEMVAGLGADVVSVGMCAGRRERYFVDGAEPRRHDSNVDLAHDARAARHLDEVSSFMAAADVVAIADYAQLTCSPALLSLLFAHPRAKTIPIVVDPHRAPDWERYSGALLMKYNEEQRYAVPSRRASRFFPSFVVTLGANGALWSEAPYEDLRHARPPLQGGGRHWRG